MARIKVGEIGVDAGMCMLIDPCYVIGTELGAMDWGDFLELPGVLHDLHAQVEFKGYQGVVVSTGYGDGTYPVYAELNSEGRVARVVVEFMENPEEG